MRQIALNDNIFDKRGAPDTGAETIKLLSERGIKNVFLWWGDDTKLNFRKVKLCQRLGLKIVFAHLQFANINYIWIEGKQGDRLVRYYKKQIKYLKKCEISIAILHPSSKDNPPPYSEIGLERFRKIVKFAEKCDVTIALENTRKKKYLAYIWDNIKSPNLKICYDAGHDHCFKDGKFDFRKYKNQIVAVHLHDNSGEKDEHKIPFEGTIDWEDVATKLIKAGFAGCVTLEVRDRNGEVSKNEFLAKAVASAQRLQEIFDKKD